MVSFCEGILPHPRFSGIPSLFSHTNIRTVGQLKRCNGHVSRITQAAPFSGLLYCVECQTALGDVLASARTSILEAANGLVRVCLNMGKSKNGLFPFNPNMGLVFLSKPKHGTSWYIQRGAFLLVHQGTFKSHGHQKACLCFYSEPLCHAPGARFQHIHTFISSVSEYESFYGCLACIPQIQWTYHDIPT